MAADGGGGVDQFGKVLIEIPCHHYRLSRDELTSKNAADMEWIKISAGKVKLLEFEKNHFVMKFVEKGTMKTRAYYNISNRSKTMQLTEHPQGKTFYHQCFNHAHHEPGLQVLAYRFNSVKEATEFVDAYEKAWNSAPVPNITLKNLVDDLVILPGDNVLEFVNKDRSVCAGLSSDGEIIYRSGEAEPEILRTPTKFSQRALQELNVDRASGNGWEQVRYQGKKLSLLRQDYVFRRNPEDSVADTNS
mmetsp:Transcript_4468/g.12522  ORF Transcript_4468/g.12522 Transcript_4468/m.12522 type:complete len:247 (-) Transcript_4468:75-815(-)|eukprot:CAMPEP_0119121736 /NCGR_PEP_ID=MMETSP1310-20130426/2228_1 /TAXON_ID=464262 /ORGANISM="Genus nov. species nov., Strain RCC2339" /LENGTH=246 /DNA_ID=CAMNT_0007111313 /DNA_START=72 /DNA_END=812 /DNA_ORIENTATION=+